MKRVAEVAEVLDVVRAAFQIVVLFLAIAALLVGEKERVRAASDLSTLMTFIKQTTAAQDATKKQDAQDDAPVFIPVDETRQGRGYGDE